MVSILETPAIRHQVSPFSVERYEQMGEQVFGRRTELIRGVVLDKMSISPQHSFLVTRLRRLLSALLGPDLYCREEKPLKLTDSMPEPDLAVVFGNEEKYLLDHPSTAVLVIEVAITSLELDLEKAALYAEAAVPEYWIVQGGARVVDVYLAPQGGRYTQHRRYASNETVRSAAAPNVILDLSAFFPATPAFPNG